ncbi:MAG TPA: hypothetical protein VE973_02390, partial [Candidatus Limnocylindria bacterium]|nr:hypothetical protein [Candidatus Limnocylindria bacterium]
KMRGDFSSTVNGKAMATHMINDGQTVYTWTDGQAMGMKMSTSAMASPTPAKEMEQQQQSVNPDAKYNYNCSPKSADDSMFQVPSNITFSDMSAMMQNAGMSASSSASSSASIKAQQCAACDSAGDNKAACLSALKCN